MRNNYELSKPEALLLKHMKQETECLKKILQNFQEEQFAILKYDFKKIESLLSTREALINKCHIYRDQLISDLNLISKNQKIDLETLKITENFHGILDQLNCTHPQLLAAENVILNLAEKIHRQSKRNAFLAEEFSLKT